MTKILLFIEGGIQKEYNENGAVRYYTRRTLMIYILTFSIPRNLSLSNIKYSYDNYGGTNIDSILRDFSIGSTRWSVPKNATTGDTAIFYCAKSARDNLGLITSHIPPNYDQKFRNFVNQQKTLYKTYSGYVLGYGVVSSPTVFDSSDGRWRAGIPPSQYRIRLSSFPEGKMEVSGDSP